MRNTIYATFNDPKLAEKAGGALLDYGVKEEDLSIIQGHRGGIETAEDVMPNQIPPVVYVAPNIGGMATGVSPFGIAPMVAINENEVERQRLRDTPEDLDDEAKHGISTTTPQDAGAGALKGTAWGAGLGAAAVLATMFVPGIGLVVGGGALASAIGAFVASAGAGAAAGAVTGYLKDQGVDAHIVDEYEQTILDGGAVLALTLPSGNVDEGKAWEVLDKYAGRNVTSYAVKPYLG